MAVSSPMASFYDRSVPKYRMPRGPTHASPLYSVAGVSRALSDPVLNPDLGHNPACGWGELWVVTTMCLWSCLPFGKRIFLSTSVPADTLCPAGLTLFIMQIFVKVRSPSAWRYNLRTTHMLYANCKSLLL